MENSLTFSRKSSLVWKAYPTIPLGYAGTKKTKQENLGWGRIWGWLEAETCQSLQKARGELLNHFRFRWEI